MFNLESPHYLRERMDLKLYDDFFNWTMTYRRDSDIYSPYGVIRKLKEKR